MAHILIVDDEKSIRVPLREFLIEEEYIVSVAETADEALDLLDQEEIDVVVTDIIMPRVSGVKLLSEIKKKSSKIEVILMTGEPSIETASEAVRAGAFDYVAKPVLKAQLLQKVALAAKTKALNDDRQRLLVENRKYQNELEQLVQARTEALAISEEKYRALYDNAPLSYQSLNADGNILDVNPAWLATLGYEREEVIGKYFGDFLEPAWLPHFEKNFPAFKKRGTVSDVRFRVMHKDGHLIDISLEGCIGYELDGSVRETYCVFQDITERNYAEARLKESEERLRLALQSANQGTYDLNVQTGEAIVSSEYASMLGADPESFVETNQEWIDRLHPDDIESTRKAYLDYIEGKTDEYKVEFRQKTGNGDWIWIQSMGSVVEWDDQGKPLRMVGIHTDITERKQAEAERAELEVQLRQSQKLEAVGAMAGGIAHDFNNILQGLYLYAGIIKDQLPDDEKLQASFQKIVNSADRAKKLVKQILTFSRKEDVDLKPLKLQYLLKEVLKLTRASTPTTIEISEDIDTSCSPILCDSTQIHQVFINLCNNAVHAMEKTGGTLSISLHEVDDQIQVEPGEQYKPETGLVELVVADTGHGMDAETLEQIFDPFFTTKGVGEGTGLGLSIVHGIIKSLQGEVSVTSQPGKGTTFRILLPITSDPIADESLVGTTTLEKKLNILFVDEDEAIRSAAKRMLELEGHRVTIASNGLEALELFQKDVQAFDLIITDLTMPKMDGVAFGKAVRLLSRQVPILLISGNLDPELKSQNETLGFDGFLRKPWTRTELLTVLSTLVRE